MIDVPDDEFVDNFSFLVRDDRSGVTGFIKAKSLYDVHLLGGKLNG